MNCTSFFNAKCNIHRSKALFFQNINVAMMYLRVLTLTVHYILHVAHWQWLFVSSERCFLTSSLWVKGLHSFLWIDWNYIGLALRTHLFTERKSNSLAENQVKAPLRESANIFFLHLLKLQRVYEVFMLGRKGYFLNHFNAKKKKIWITYLSCLQAWSHSFHQWFSLVDQIQSLKVICVCHANVSSWDWTYFNTLFFSQKKAKGWGAWGKRMNSSFPVHLSFYACLPAKYQGYIIYGIPIYFAHSTMLTSVGDEEVSKELSSPCSPWPYLQHQAPSSGWGAEVMAMSWGQWRVRRAGGLDQIVYLGLGIVLKTPLSRTILFAVWLHRESRRSAAFENPTRPNEQRKVSCCHC